MNKITRLATTCLLGATMLAGVLPATAQQSNPFAPAVMVNNRAVTNYDIEQRIRFMEVLNTPGNLQEQAYDALVDDRLRLDAAAAIGIRLSDEEVLQGMTEFAGRANLGLEEFVAALAQEGVSREAFRDFVAAGIAWRQVVRARFGPRSQVSEAEIDRALALQTQAGSARVLLSEIILRADTPEFAEQAQELAPQLAENIQSTDAFAAAARQYSASQSAQRGGRIDWLDLTQLPPAIASNVLTLGPGEVTDPIPVPNAIALFQLRALEETEPKPLETQSVEYMRYAVPADGRLSADEVVARLDTCDDLYGIAKDQPEEALSIETLAIADVPADVALELAKLDANETVIRPRGEGAEVLMLCARTAILAEDIDREAIRGRLFNQRLTSYADSYLQELKAEAIIRQP
ncbi:peptidylprolyl isomerase [Rhodovulum sp. FJ3]|uniref:peptidylprolyl isomerase n=1 Tax=Rhodovulum sp. FJ3 TaxID=3079053 RepID=UPI00293DE063|nr:peptidylprolyl isomerase [Rhodovulum sp. FJ3]MDV4167654.1 peptidylprolyl isomerase [Rhodovulum sp. FJ3]